MNRKKLYTGILGIFLAATAMFFSTQAFSAPVQRIHQIRLPLFGYPEFAVKGGAFDIVLKLDAGVKPDSASLVSITDDKSVVALTITENNSSPEGTFYKATLPKDAPEGLYNLKVDFSGGASDTQPHAVKVISSYKKDFDFIHLTDIHFNTQHVEGQDSNLVRIKLLDDINALNPEFVLFGGDLGLNPDTYDVDYVTGWEILTKELKVPVFMIPGNHEQYIDKRGKEKIDGRKYWDATYGPYYFSFDYGNVHVTGLNTFDWTPKWRDRWDDSLVMTGAAANSCMSPEQFDWFKKDLETATKASKYPVVYTHIPVGFLQGGRKLGFAPPEKIKGPTPDQFSKVLEDYKVPYIFVGHMHYNYDDKKLNSVTTEIMTQASGSDVQSAKDPLWGFRIVHVKDAKIAGFDIHAIPHSSAQKK